MMGIETVEASRYEVTTQVILVPPSAVTILGMAVPTTV